MIKFDICVVEAASSSVGRSCLAIPSQAPYTQTKIGGSIEPPIFFYFLAKSLEISRFRNINVAEHDEQPGGDLAPSAASAIDEDQR